MALVPATSELTHPFWAGLAADRILVQRCAACSGTQHPPLPRCRVCHHDELGWTELSGAAVVYAYTVVTHPAHVQLADSVPYVVALVEAAEGHRFVTDVIDVDPWTVHIGMPVRLTGVALDGASEGIGLLHARPATSS